MLFFAIFLLFFAKIMQTSAMKACFQIAECSLSYAKIQKNITINLIFHPLVSYKDKTTFL